MSSGPPILASGPQTCARRGQMDGWADGHMEEKKIPHIRRHRSLTPSGPLPKKEKTGKSSVTTIQLHGRENRLTPQFFRQCNDPTEYIFFFFEWLIDWLICWSIDLIVEWFVDKLVRYVAPTSKKDYILFFHQSIPIFAWKSSKFLFLCSISGPKMLDPGPQEGLFWHVVIIFTFPITTDLQGNKLMWSTSICFP